MTYWSDMHKRSQGLATRKEDKPCEFWEIGSFKGTLDSTTKDLLREIHDFKGFAPFLPEDILKPEGDVRVILDDKKSRYVTLTLAELEEELRFLEEVVRSLKELLDNLRKSKSTNDGEIGEIHRKIKKLQKRIRDLDGIISRLRKEGKDSETFEIELLGYYIRAKYPKPAPEEGIPEIHLMMGTLMSKPNPLFFTGITFVHELMHAFFDNHIPYVAHPHCPRIEEPIAEYGMLCFMEMFERTHPDYKGILDVAKKHVEEKQDSLGVCHYGFGAYLFEDRTDFGVDWVSLFHSSCPTLIMSSPEVQAYELTISPIKYPYYERACEWNLFDVLRASRFLIKNASNWRNNGKQVYFTITANVAKSIPFMIDYPTSRDVSITFKDKIGTRLFTLIASVVSPSQRKFLLGAQQSEVFARYFGFGKREFIFYEERPSDGIHPAEWVACEL